MIKHFCNCCEKLLDGKNWTRVEYRLIEIDNDLDISHESSKIYSDLCPDCFKNFTKILNGGKDND